MTTITAVAITWVDACALDVIAPGTGACALVAGKQVAVFRLADGAIHAIGNLDPFSGVQCLSRGIVGDAAGVPTVAAPVYKQRFDLRTGVCLDDASVTIPVHPARVRGGRVEVQPGS